MEYTESVVVKIDSKGAPVTANFAPPPSDEKMNHNPGKVRADKQTELVKHDEKK
jgi:hypothetical protein